MRLLDISPFKNAINSFSNMLKLAKIIEEQDEEDRIFYSYEGARAGVIYHFKLAYNLSYKFMVSWLEVYCDYSVNNLYEEQLLKFAQEKELIDDFEIWLSLLSAKNNVINAYDEDLAEELYGIATGSLVHFKNLLINLEGKI